jgi:hypothetical protein
VRGVAAAAAGEKKRMKFMQFGVSLMRGETMSDKDSRHRRVATGPQPWRTLTQLADLWGTSGERTQRLANWLARTGRLEVKEGGEEDPVLYRLPKE